MILLHHHHHHYCRYCSIFYLHLFSTHLYSFSKHTHVTYIINLCVLFDDVDFFFCIKIRSMIISVRIRSDKVEVKNEKQRDPLYELIIFLDNRIFWQKSYLSRMP